MKDLHYVVSDEVFDRFPGFLRGVVVSYGVTNGPAPSVLVDMLRAAEDGIRQDLTLDAVAGHPRIKAWRDAFRAFGAKPSEYRSSIEAMARRVLRGDPLPSINTLVDIGNLVSLWHLVPAGAHAIDLATAGLTLRPATGSEAFISLDSSQVEHPDPGEIIFAQADRVLTRRWTWRQGRDTLVQTNTSAVEFNVDGLPPVTPAEVSGICEEIEGLVRRFCGGHTRHEILSSSHPSMSINDWQAP